MATALGLSASTELIELERLRYVNQVLHQHVLTYISLEQFTGILDEDLSRGSLYDILAAKHDVKLVRNEILVRLDRIEGPVARALHVEDGTHILAMDSLVFDADGDPVAFGVARHTPATSEIAISLGVDV